MRGHFPISELHNFITTETPVFLELGAHHGWPTRTFLQEFPKAQVFAWEPDPRNVTRFRQLVRSDRVTLYPAAIGATDGETTFYVSGGPGMKGAHYGKPEGWTFSGSIRKPTVHLEYFPEVTFDKQITVPLMSLDKWFRDTCPVEVIDFIWADLQGAEEDMIAGGRETLAHTLFAHLEYSDHGLYEQQIGLQQLLALLPDFETVEIFKTDVLVRNKRLAR